MCPQKVEIKIRQGNCKKGPEFTTNLRIKILRRLVEVLITSRLDGSKFDQLACGSSVRLEMMTGLLHVFHDSVAGTHSSMILVGRVAWMSEVHVGHINRMVWIFRSLLLLLARRYLNVRPFRRHYWGLKNHIEEWNSLTMKEHTGTSIYRLTLNLFCDSMISC